MAKIDRSVLQANDQNMGDFGDPNKLEASISHLADKIDSNDDETQVLKADNNSNKGRLNVLEADVSVLKTDNSSNKSRITNNESDIAYNEGRLTELLRNNQKASEVADARAGFPALRDRVEAISIDVKAFGAVGDGVTDDTTAFQNAVTYASANNKRLSVNGSYNIGTLDLKCSIFGNGKTSKIKCKNINITNVSNIFIDGVEIVTDGQLDGLKLLDASNVTISRSKIETTYAGAYVPLPVTVERCDHFKFHSNVLLVGNLQIKSSKNIKITNNLIDGQLKNNNDLIKCTHGTSGLIDGNTLINSNGDAIDTYTSGERMVITNNHIENTKNSGIEAKVILRDPPYTAGSSDQDGFVESTIISNNVFKNIGGATADNYGAIKNTYSDLRTSPTFDQKNTPRSFVITNNIIEDINLTPGASGDYHGIVTDAHNSLIANNIIRNVYKGNGGVNSGTGIYFAGKAADCIAKGNVISGAQTNGIYASANKGLVLDGNIIAKDKVSNIAQVYGLRLSALEKCSIVNNLISDSTTYAIYASGDLAKTNISGNTLENGAEFVKLTDVRIANNDIYNKSLFAGSSGQQSNRVSIIGNHVRDTGTSAGVFLRNTKGAIISDNMFNSVSYGAVIQNESTYVQAKNNTTGAQLNTAAEGIVFSSVTTTNQATSVVSGNMVIPA